MQVHLSPDQEAHLIELAVRDGRTRDQLVQEPLEQFFAADADFIEAAMKGLSSLSRGETFDARTSQQAGRPIF
jgi:predicted transcriptional regulator